MITTDTVLAFMSSVFSWHGNLLSVVMDNGVQFTSASFASFPKDRQISHNRSSLYNHPANGAIKRFNRVLKQTIQLAIQQHQPWKPTVVDFLQVYCTTPHTTTGSSPWSAHANQTDSVAYCSSTHTSRDGHPPQSQPTSTKDERLQ